MLQAIKLLKPGGRFVYSTCTYNIQENEEIVRWGLQNFPEIEVKKVEIQIGETGFKIDGLNDQQIQAMQRFGEPPMTGKFNENDSIGFFMCCFEKKIN